MVCGPLSEALEKQWDAPTHFSTYYVTGADEWHRMRKVHSSDKDLIGRLFTEMLVMDYDRPKLPNKENPQSPLKNPWTSQDDIDDMLVKLDASPLWPSILYVTKHGLRLIYLLDEPVPVTQSEHLYRVMLGQLADIGIQSDDSTVDWTRFFALPYITTGDWKPETDDEGKPLRREWIPGDKSWENPFVAGSLIITDSRVSVRALRAKKEAPNILVLEGDKPDLLVSQTLVAGENGAQTEFYKKAKKLLANNAFVDIVFSNHAAPFDAGKRNTSIFKMVGSITTRLWGKIEGMTVEHLFALMEPCLRNLETDSCDVMWEQLCRTWEGFHNREEVKRIDVAEAERVMLEGFRDQLAMGGLSLEREAKKLGETERGFMRRFLILTINKLFYLMGLTGKYRTSPIGREGLCTAVSGMGLDDVYGMFSSDGSEVSLDTVLRRSCSSLNRLEGRLGLGKNEGELSGFASGELVLTTPTYYLREIAPEFSQDVDTFLRKFAGRNYGRLIDWLGHAQDVHRPICALSISGAGETGKSFLGDLMGHRFGPGGKSDESVLTSQWNDGLMRNPVIHADEGLSGSAQNVKRIDQMLRLTVTGGSMEIRQRRMDSRTMEVYPRLIITANDLDALRTALGSKLLEQDSRDALMTRMLHIEAQPEAAKWLADMGGRTFTETWIKGEGVALKHLAHLFETRDQPSIYAGSGRLLVMGSDEKYGDTGAKTITEAFDESPLQSLMLQALCMAMSKIATGQAQSAVVVDGPWVKTTASRLHGYIELTSFGHKLPSLHSIGRSMRTVASRMHGKKKGPRVWLVCLERLAKFADEIGAEEKVCDKIWDLTCAQVEAELINNE